MQGTAIIKAIDYYQRFAYTELGTPTAKAMGFLFLRPLHCHKDFSFTESPQA